MSAAPADVTTSGSPHKTCAVAGCNRAVEVWRKSKLCVVCEKGKRFNAARARLHAALQSSIAERQDVQAPRCMFCTRPVVLVHPVVVSKYVVCLECMGSSEQLQNAHISEPNVGPSGPQNLSPFTAHLAVQRTAASTIAPKPVEPIVVVPDPVSHTPTEAPDPANSTARAALNNPQLSVPTSQAIALRPPPSMQITSSDPTPDSGSTQQSSTPPVSQDSLLQRQLGVVFNHWDKTERVMAALAGKPHFNGKGEHIFPYLSARSGADKNCNISTRQKRTIQSVGAPVSPSSTQAVREPLAKRPALVSPTRSSSSAWTPPPPITVISLPVRGPPHRSAIASRPHTHTSAIPARIDDTLLKSPGPPPLSSSTSRPPVSATSSHPTALHPPTTSLPSSVYPRSTRHDFPPVIALPTHETPSTRTNPALLPAPRLLPTPRVALVHPGLRSILPRPVVDARSSNAPHAGCETPRRAHPAVQATPLDAPPSVPHGSTRMPSSTDIGGAGPHGEHRHPVRAYYEREQALPAPGGGTQRPSQQEPPRGTGASAAPSLSSASRTSLPPQSHVTGVQHRRPLARHHLTLAGVVRPSLQPALPTQVRSSAGPAPVADARAANAWPDEPSHGAAPYHWPAAPGGSASVVLPPRPFASPASAAPHRPSSPLPNATTGTLGPSSSSGANNGSRSFSCPPRTPSSSQLVCSPAHIEQAAPLSTILLPHASLDSRTVVCRELVRNISTQGATLTREVLSQALPAAFRAHSREALNPETSPPRISPSPGNITPTPVGPLPSSHSSPTTPPFTPPQPRSDARSTVFLSDPPSFPGPGAASTLQSSTPPSPVSPAFSQTSTLVGTGSTSTLSPSTFAVDDPRLSDLSDLTPLASSDSEPDSEPEVSLKSQLAQRRRLVAQPPHTCATPACHNLLARGEGRRLCAPCHDRTRTRAGRGLVAPAAAAAAARTCTRCPEKVEPGLPWRMCEACRVSARTERRTRRRRRAAAEAEDERAVRKRARLDQESARPEIVDAPVVNCPEDILAPVCRGPERIREVAAAERMCTSCHKMFECVGPWKTCARCRTKSRTWWRERRMSRKKDEGSSKKQSRMAQDDVEADAGSKTLAGYLSMVESGPPMVYPTSGLLVEDLSTSISEFASRSVFPTTAGPQLPLDPPTLAFAGEYSLVADSSGRDPLVRLHEMQREVSSALGMAFSLAELQCLSDGVSGRWSCAHEIPMPSTTTVDEGAMAGTPPAAPTPALPASPLDAAREAQSSLGDDAATPSGATVRRLLGQLDVSVIWDRSHPIFIGVKTLVVVKLAG